MKETRPPDVQCAQVEVKGTGTMPSHKHCSNIRWKDLMLNNAVIILPGRRESPSVGISA